MTSAFPDLMDILNFDKYVDKKFNIIDNSISDYFKLNKIN